MERIWELGRARWPDVDVTRDELAQHLDRLSHAGSHVDLYLACACTRQDPAACAALDREVFSEVPAFVARIDPSPWFADEVRQSLRERLLVGRPGHPPRIAEYSGRGPLGAWVRVAAVRVALDLRGEGGQQANVDLEQTPERIEQATPELALLKARHQDAYQEALRVALDTLSAKDRNILRMNVVDGLSIDRIGLAYQVHRATAARWVTAVRQRLLDETYRLLGVRLQLSPNELASLAALVQSQLHISLSRLIGPDK